MDLVQFVGLVEGTSSYFLNGDVTSKLFDSFEKKKTVCKLDQLVMPNSLGYYGPRILKYVIWKLVTLMLYNAESTENSPQS